MDETTVAAILVGGKGTRLRSVISDLPKPLAPVAGEPFLFLTLRNLVAAGIKKVILLTGYQHEKIVAACGDGRQFGLEITYSQEFEPLGTGGALRNAKLFLQEFPHFLLLNGDTYFEDSLLNFVNSPLIPDCVGLIGLVRVLNASRFGSVKINELTQNIISFQEKGGSTPEWVNAGLYKLSSHVFNYIPAEPKFSSLENDVFPGLLKQQLILKYVQLHHGFCDIGLPESYAQFNASLTEAEKNA